MEPFSLRNVFLFRRQPAEAKVNVDGFEKLKKQLKKIHVQAAVVKLLCTTGTERNATHTLTQTYDANEGKMKRIDAMWHHCVAFFPLKIESVDFYRKIYT